MLPAIQPEVALLQRIERLSARTRFMLVASLAALAVLLGLVIQHWGRDLTTPATPLGGVSLQLAGDSLAAAWMLDTWDAEPAFARRAKAATTIGMDFLYIPVYVTLIAFCCLLAATKAGWAAVRTMGKLAVTLVVAAGLFDIIENTALLMMLFSSVDPPWPQLARLCSLAKFTLIAVAVLYTTVTWAVATTASALRVTAHSKNHA
jgi:hypothetical protein